MSDVYADSAPEVMWERIKELESQVLTWIPVSERPEGKQMTLVVYHNPNWNDPPHITPSNWDGTTWTVDDEFVTCWMPLSALPTPPSARVDPQQEK